MTYPELERKLLSLSDESYRLFHGKLLRNEKIELYGVRVPLLRKLAREMKGEWETLRTFPDGKYEVTFLKCLVLGMQPYEVFVKELPALLPSIDNWATCDCFDCPQIRSHLEDFLPHIRIFLSSEHEFTSRYALVSLLRYYMDGKYFPAIFRAAEECDHAKYYVSMAAAWLIAEVAVHDFGAAKEFLEKGTLPDITRRRAVQKACESFRLSEFQKNELRRLRR